MNNNDVNKSRRKLLRGTTGGLLSVAVAGILPVSRAIAAKTPELDPNLPAAAALGYSHDASTVDTAKYPARVSRPGVKQECRNCNLYLAEGSADWGGCRIFPGYVVNASGWCTAWVPK